MGRDATHAEELTDAIQRNAIITVGRANELLERANLKSISEVVSGWRPTGINSITANAAQSSRHLTGEAIDIADPDRTLATWIADNLDVLREVGLWCEDFRWTPTWVHLQVVPPKSGKTVFIPSAKPPLDPDFEVTWA